MLSSTPVNLVVGEIPTRKCILSRAGEHGHFYWEKRSINGDGVVTDHATGLMWHQNGSNKYVKWNKAKEWVRSLNSRGYAGHQDWRLPTVDEAVSLLESNKRTDLYIDPIFSNKQKWIWTGDRFGSEAAWHVYFDHGAVHWYGLNYDGFVRPVRSVE